MLKGFRDFIVRGNVIDLAVAVVIGAAFNSLVTSFTENLLTPLLAAIGGQPDFGAIAFTVNGSVFGIGAFLDALISFLLIAAVIYFLIVSPMNRMLDRVRPPAGPSTRECPECLSAIPLGARRCAFCTVEVAQVTATEPV
jgi:large conductance mechanosensitive channel